MRPEQFLEAMGYLDDDLLADAMPPAAAAEAPAPAPRSLRWVRILAAAAVFVLLLAGVRFALKRQPKTPQTAESEATGVGVAAQTATTGTALPATSEAPAVTIEGTQTQSTPAQGSGKKTDAAPAKSTQPATGTRSNASAAPGSTAAKPTQRGSEPAGNAATRNAAATTAAATRAPTEKPTQAPSTAAATTVPSSAEAPEENTPPNRLLAFFAPDGTASSLWNTQSLERLFGADDAGSGYVSPNPTMQPTLTDAPEAQSTESTSHRLAEPTVRPTAPITKAPTRPEKEDSDYFTRTTQAPNSASCPDENGNAFGGYCGGILQTEARLADTLPQSKTAAELEALYGGRFLPAEFPGTETQPLSSIAPHGVYYEAGNGNTTLLNRCEYRWADACGGEYRLLLYAVRDDGSYPAAALSAQEAFEDANGVRIFFRYDAGGASPFYTALAKRGDTVLWFTMCGDCTRTAFLRLVRSALW